MPAPELLLQFREKHADAFERIKSAMRDGPNGQAAQLAHAIKGVAGNMGADGLYRSAGELETAFKLENPAACDGLFDNFKEHLSRVMEAIKGLEKPSTGNAEVSTHQAASPGDIAPLLRELRICIRSDFVRAKEHIRTLKDLLGPSMKEEFDTLAQCLDAFEEEDASSCLDGIFQKLKISTEDA